MYGYLAVASILGNSAYTFHFVAHNGTFLSSGFEVSAVNSEDVSVVSFLCAEIYHTVPSSLPFHMIEARQPCA